MICFTDSNGPDFEFLLQKLAAIQQRCGFLHLIVIIKNLIVLPSKSKKIDPLA